MTERRLNGMAALVAAQNTPLRVLKDEKHTEFVKRIVNAYLDAYEAISGDGRDEGGKTMLDRYVDAVEAK